MSNSHHLHYIFLKENGQQLILICNTYLEVIEYIRQNLHILVVTWPANY